MMLQAEEQHHGHAQAEQVIADWTDGPLGRLPCAPRERYLAGARRDQLDLLRPQGPLASTRLRQSPRRLPRAATSSASPPATAAGTSPCTCPKTGTASTSG